MNKLKKSVIASGKLSAFIMLVATSFYLADKFQLEPYFSILVYVSMFSYVIYHAIRKPKKRIYFVSFSHETGVGNMLYELGTDEFCVITAQEELEQELDKRSVVIINYFEVNNKNIRL